MKQSDEPLSVRLAAWVHGYQVQPSDVAPANIALRDTLAVTLAAQDDGIAALAGALSKPSLCAALAHVIDYDDLHVPSTTHISAVCVPATVFSGGAATAFIAGAGVMARVGQALGWKHYSAGWHATCTAGAIGAAASVASSIGLSVEETAHALVLAVPGAGGVQRAFGTLGKSLQVGFAVEAGVRAARLAQLGARSDLGVLEDWMELVRGNPAAVRLDGPGVPGGLAIKLSPCCYALQRPIFVTRLLPEPALEMKNIAGIRLSAPLATVQPLIHHRPTTDLEAKFSLEYAVACAVLGPREGPLPFTNEWVGRADIQELMRLVEFTPTGENGSGLLDGELEISVELRSGEIHRARGKVPPGAPDRPPTENELKLKIRACCGEESGRVESAGWADAPAILEGVMLASDARRHRLLDGIGAR
jgi:2-methylcitrate dehydratase PrpD